MFGEDSIDPFLFFIVFLGIFLFGLFIYFVGNAMGDLGLSKDDGLDKWEDHLLDKALGFTKKKKK